MEIYGNNTNLSDLSDIMLGLDLNGNNGNANGLSSNWYSKANYYSAVTFSDRHLLSLTQQLRRESSDQMDSYWEGLQTINDKRMSAQFQCILLEKSDIICPNCRLSRMDARNGHLVCECGFHLPTMLSIKQISDRMVSSLETHANHCVHMFPRFDVFKSNLIICCDKCSYCQHIL